eukprot:contig_12195_g2919
MERTILSTLHPQLEATTHLLHGRERQRRLHIEKALGVNSYMPALAAMGGLTTAPFLLYKIIGFDVLHVLDLGVTRLLVHRLVQIFPSLCDGHDPLCGSLVATYAESNGRLQFLGRRCRATLAGSDYFMSAKDKQSTFTGREQRQGVWILPFLVAGIFDRGRRKPAKQAPPPAAVQQPASPAPQTDAARASAAATVNGPAAPRVSETPDNAGSGVSCDEDEEASAAIASGGDGQPAQDADPARELLRGLWGSINAGEDAAIPEDEEELGAARTNDGVDKEDMSAAQSNSKFDWAAYRRAFPDTLPHAAITAMFAEYALLVGRITRHLGAAVASPMTLAEGEGIAKQAQEFVLCYAVPILGPLHTTKVHKLLAHLLEAVWLHSNPMNGDTSLNEQKHKEDKRHYVRTNKSKLGYLRQLVRHSNGSRSVLRCNQAARAAFSADGPAVSGSGEDDCDSDMEGSDAVDNGRGAADVDTDFMAVDATADAVRPPTPGTAPPSAGDARVAAQDLLLRPVGAYLRLVKVAHLASWPGLSAVGDFLGLSAADRVRVMTYMHFATRVHDGFQERQLVRATPQYRGAAWYDSIAFRCRDDGDDTPERFGQVMALLRLEDADFAIVAEMVRTGVSDGPLTSRGCTHLRWAWLPSTNPGPGAGAGSVRLLCVPVNRWHRVVHVVPDFADLFLRRGVGALPVEFGGADRDVRDQRYMFNAFLPSGGVRLHERDVAGGAS